ncbi:unnamed protein product [Nezara viridula]|uniref:PDZ domain-containing protein 8 n=1 Tax=Nezara viridula TaxID=85310 RepID=A0A9P0HHW2_NEZVI|nr:unnamed protein product [Nezara viridula]
MGFLVFLVLMLLCFIAGIAVTIFVQWYLFNLYIDKLPYVGPASKPVIAPFSLPKAVLEEEPLGKEPAGSINALLQFLFQECRNTKRVRKWFRHRLSLELEELLTRTTTGKLFEKIVLRDLDLGSHLPAIRSIEVKTLSVDPGTKLIEEVELCLDLEYSGGFQLSIDASTRLSKLAHVSVKVNELSGKGMLKFTRYPYTHWCFSFYNDPTLQLEVETQFQGRSWAQVNSIIANQIRKSLKRKHTLPFYKIRYKPFFVKPEIDSLVEEEETQPGLLELTVVEATRLSSSPGPVFCNVAIDSSAWIELTHSGTASYLTVDVSVTKQPGPHIGINFKQEFISDKYQVGVVVESVSNPLCQDLKSGDIVVMVEGKNVQSLSALNKIIKQCQNKVTLRVERKLKLVLGNEDKVNQGETFGLRSRSIAAGDKTDSDSSNPPSSSDSPAKRSISGSPEHSKGIPRLSLCSDAEMEASKPQMFSTKDVPFSKVVQFNETFKINVLPDHKYVNLSVWSRGAEKNNLLGHISLPVKPHCCPPSPGHHVAMYSLLPPNPNLTTSIGNSLASHPGFEPCLCFGDVLLSFAFTGTGSSPGNQTSTSSPPTPAPSSSSSSTALPEIPEIISGPKHDFVRTHFEKVTQCGFCFKKIWLKDALQCEGCLMSCHKKCAVKAQAGPGCARTNPRRPSVQPEIITTPPDDINAQASVVEENLFSLRSGEQINDVLEALLSRPHDEGLMDAAKASGKMLFADFPPNVRKGKIDEMMSKIKHEIDAESQNHAALQREEQNSENATTKAKIAFLVGKSEERLQALTVLMLHCCAGLQDTREGEEAS